MQRGFTIIAQDREIRGAKRVLGGQIGTGFLPGTGPDGAV